MIARRVRCILFAAALLGGFTVGDLGAQTVSVSPSTKHVLPGSSTVLDVRVDGVANVHGASVTLSFNNAVVNYTAVAQGGFLSSGGDVVFFNRNPAPGPSVTSVVVDQAILGQGAVSGSGVLFTITFQGIGAGTSAVSITAASLRDVNNNTISYTAVSGQVIVGNPSLAFVDPAYNAGSAGGHEFGYDAFATAAPAIAAVSAGGTIQFAAATYNESITVSKNVAFTGTPAIQDVQVSGGALLDLQTDLQVNGTLTLNGGSIATGTHRVRITAGSASAVSITTGAVAGTVERTIAAGSTGDFQFTDAQTRLTPSGSQGAMTVSVTSFPNTLPPGIGGGTAIRRYYTITPSGPLTATLRLAYAESELNSIAETNLMMFRHNGSVWVAAGGTVNAAGNYIEQTAVSGFGNWTMGDVDHPLPIQLSSFSATVTSGHNVLVTWTTIGEIRNLGFYVERRLEGDLQFEVIPGSFQAGHGTTAVEYRYGFTDAGVGNGRWEYRLRQLDLDSTVHFSPSITVTVLTDVREDAPASFALAQNYPNPFNPSTEIRFSVERGGPTTLRVFDLQGRQVESLYDGSAEAGRIYVIRFSAGRLASGTYLYQLRNGAQTAIRKLMLVK